MDLMLVEILVSVQKKRKKLNYIFFFLKVAGPARASRLSIWLLMTTLDAD
jgi:hypothetical protein